MISDWTKKKRGGEKKVQSNRKDYGLWGETKTDP